MAWFKFLFIAFLSYLGIRRFSPELFEDFRKNIIEYCISVMSGLFTYMSLPFEIDVANPITLEFIKLFFALLTVVCVIPLQFVVRKMLDKIYIKYFKKK